MRLGIMQPYFFPYLGYFDLILKTDEWVVFDVVKYQPKSWMNRNRILDVNNQTQLISAPVERKSGVLISEMQLSDFDIAAKKLLKQLDQYKKHAPYFESVRTIVLDVLANCTDNRLVTLNTECLKKMAEYLDIPFKYQLCSTSNLDLRYVTGPGQWALEIAKQLNAASYLNPPGGVGIFEPNDWIKAGIELEFSKMPNLNYDVGQPFNFQPNLSIIDVLMWCHPTDVVEHLMRVPTVSHQAVIEHNLLL